jgi:hypothetical protein
MPPPPAAMVTSPKKARRTIVFVPRMRRDWTTEERQSVVEFGSTIAYSPRVCIFHSLRHIIKILIF